VFVAKLTFVRYVYASWFPVPTGHLVPQPPDYPLSPFKMRFEPPLFHPNSKQVTFSPRPLRLASLCLSSRVDGLLPVYPDGNVCISILHTPGDDPLMYEQASERWSPVQSVEKVLLSVISMLAGKRFTFHFWTLCLATTPTTLLLRAEPRKRCEH
jgi:hypothetical protein